MSDTMTVRDLREALAKLPAFESDYTNVTDIRIKPEHCRIRLTTRLNVDELTEEKRSLVTANNQLRKDIAAQQTEMAKLTSRMAAIRNQRRSRSLNLP